MADLWRVTYMGEGVKSTSVGAFAKYTTAFVEEHVAKELATHQGFVVADPTGKELGGGAKTAEAPKAEPKHEKKDEKHAEKAKDEKKDEKHAEKAKDEKHDKKDEKPAEKK